MSPTNPSQHDSPEHDRFRRQRQFAPLGEQGQMRLEQSSVAISGCGALGSVLAERLVRAGVGKVRLIDRDWVEWDNLPRQTLFTEEDARQKTPKAIAARDALQQIRRESQLEAIVEDLTFRNAERLLGNVDLIFDGTDNFETRFLINDFSIAKGVPWIHGGCIGAQGQILVIRPGLSACFRCLVPEPPSADSVGTCDTVGVLGPAVSVIASWQAIEGIKLLSGATSASVRQLIQIDLWEGTMRKLSLDRLHEEGNCPTCKGRNFEFLEGRRSASTTVLCGRNSVQVHANEPGSIDLKQLALRWQKSCSSSEQVIANAFMVRLLIDSKTITVFQDVRAVISGTEDPAIARSLYARWIGS